MNYFLILIFGYLIGSIPTAYLLLKNVRNLDITKNGSGNVGAMNSFYVSKSKKIGLLVLSLDFLKGATAVSFAALAFGYQFDYLALALFSAVVGHCFSIWINFKGGKGLATAAGGSVIFVPTLLVIWLICWGVSYVIKKDINLSNIIASLFSVLIFFSLTEYLNEFSFAKATSNIQFILGCTSVLTVILIKHYNNIIDYFRSN